MTAYSLRTPRTSARRVIVGLLTGLPDAYGRGRIIGDYRRVALYGVNRLIEEKQKDKDALGEVPTTEKRDPLCERKLSDQIKALKDMIAMAASLWLRHLPSG